MLLLIILVIITFYIGAFVGFFLKTWINHRASYNGTIFITRDLEKTLYSLELNEEPEMIEFKKEMIFKVDASQKNLDRE